MSRVINVGRFAPGTTAPQTSPITYANGQTFLQGSPLVLTNGVASECAANPTSIYGFAASPYNGGAGFQMANTPTQVTGRNQDVPCFLANSGQEFTSNLVNGSAVLVTPALADIGTSVGLSKQTIGGVATWVVDKAATACLMITDIELDAGAGTVYFKIKAANIQVI